MTDRSLTRIGVLASGGGSNLQALLGFLAGLGTARGGDVVVVASDRPAAVALSCASAAGVATEILASDRVPDGMPLGRVLAKHDVQLLVLAGYLKLVPSEVTRRLAGRIVNVHPAPLPAFGGAGMYGRRAHRAVLQAGVAFTGPTVHFVDEVYDRGAMIAHWPVPVLPEDDEHSLAGRVLRAEHLLFPRVVQALANGDLRAAASGAPPPTFFRLKYTLAPFDESLDDSALGAVLDAARAV